MSSNRISKSIALAVSATSVAAAALSPLPAGAKGHSPAAYIRNSGSNNTLGYTIAVYSSGAATYRTENSAGSAQLPGGMAQRLFSDIASGRPLSHLPTSNCLKSAGFGTFTYIGYNSDRTPDVSCPGNDVTAALFSDAKNIAATLGIADIPRQPAPR